MSEATLYCRKELERMPKRSMGNDRSYYHRVSNQPLVYRTFADVLYDGASTYGTKEAFVFFDDDGVRNSISYRELEKESWRLASYIMTVYNIDDIKLGQRVALCGPSCREYVVAQFALLRLSISCFFVWPTLGNPAGIEKCVFDTGRCSGLIIYEGFEKSQTIWESATGKWADQVKLSLIFGNSTLGDSRKASVREVIQRDLPVETHLARVNEAERLLSPESECFVCTTSGSTGTPKLVATTPYALLNAGAILRQQLKCDFSTKHLLHDPGPMHIEGASMTMPVGATMVIPGGVAHLDDESDTLKVYRTLVAEQCTSALLMGCYLADFCTIPDIDADQLMCLQTVEFSGYILPLKLAKEFAERLPHVTLVNVYGSNELQSVAFSDNSTSSSPVDLLQLTVAPNIEVCVQDASGLVLPREVEGELCFRGSTNFLGYLDDCGKPSGGLDRHHWYHTGDIARMEANGRITILGRTNDMINVETMHFFPAPLAREIGKHPDVDDVEVFGVPDPRLYQRICACVVASRNVSEEELMTWCQGRFAIDVHSGVSAAPSYICFFDSFPRSRSGKVDRKTLYNTAIERLPISVATM